MIIISYSDYTDTETITKLCEKEVVIFDFKFYDIPSTMRRNIKKCAKLGAYAVTLSDCPLNIQGIDEAILSGAEYGIKIIVGDINVRDPESC